MTGATMKRVGFVLGLLLLGQTSAFAAVCRPDQKLSLVGSNTGSAVLSSSAQQIKLVVVNCTSTACVAGLYDAAGLGTASTSTVVMEPGTAASQTILVPNTGLFEQPLEFTSGVTFVDDGNVSWIGVYACVQR